MPYRFFLVTQPRRCCRAFMGIYRCYYMLSTKSPHDVPMIARCTSLHRSCLFLFILYVHHQVALWLIHVFCSLSLDCLLLDNVQWHSIFHTLCVSPLTLSTDSCIFAVAVNRANTGGLLSKHRSIVWACRFRRVCIITRIYKLHGARCMRPLFTPLAFVIATVIAMHSCACGNVFASKHVFDYHRKSSCPEKEYHVVLPSGEKVRVFPQHAPSDTSPSGSHISSPIFQLPLTRTPQALLLLALIPAIPRVPLYLCSCDCFTEQMLCRHDVLLPLS